jgi:DNA-directed RNA polymerase specialized sigma24 family protein
VYLLLHISCKKNRWSCHLPVDLCRLLLDESDWQAFHAQPESKQRSTLYGALGCLVVSALMAPAHRCADNTWQDLADWLARVGRQRYQAFEEDWVQEVCYKLVRYINTGKKLSGRSFFAFVTRILVNYVRDVAAHQKAQKNPDQWVVDIIENTPAERDHDDDWAERMPLPQLTVEQMVIVGQAELALRQFLGQKLTATQAPIAYLYWRYGLNPRDIATLLERTPNAVRCALAAANEVLLHLPEPERSKLHQILAEINDFTG